MDDPSLLQTLAADRVIFEAIRAFRQAGIRPILLKGPSIASWLYPLGGRHYTDCDLLVGPGDRTAAEKTLRGLGFTNKLAEMRQSERERHSVPWEKEGTAVEIDLHAALPGANAGHDMVWRVLSAHSISQRFGSLDIDVLDHDALGMHVVLHAAEDGLVNPQVAEDLRRVLGAMTLSEWRRSAAIAREAGATESFAAGLRLMATGEAVAASLGLPAVTSPEVALRAAGHPPTAVGIATILGDPRWSRRGRMLAGRIFPTPAFLRRWYPTARRGRWGLVSAYLRRWWWIARNAPTGYMKWRAQSPDDKVIKEPVKLLMYSWALAPSVGGVERLTDVMARHLTDRGYDVRVMTATPEPSQNGRYTVMREPGFFQLFAHLRWADVVHFNTFNSRLMLAAVLTRTPVVWQHIDFDTVSPRGICYRMGHPCRGQLRECFSCLRQDHAPLQTARPWLSLMAKRWGKRWVAANLVSSRYAAVRLGLSSSEMVTFGIETEKFPYRERDADRRTLSVLFCARHIPGKGCDVLLRALAHCKEAGVDFRATIAGDGPTRANSEALAMKLGLERQVHFAGRISDAELVDALRQSDVTVIPTLQDEIGQLMSLEALSCGSCVCVSDIGAFREQLEGVALLFPTGNAQALAKHLGTLASDPGLRRRLSSEGRRRAEQRFEVAQMAARYDQIFRSTVATNAK